MFVRKVGNVKKEEIKKEALSLFAEKGYAGTSLSAIAKKVHIQTSSLYAHFQSKDDLYLQIYREQLQEQFQQTKQILSKLKGTTVYERLQAVFFSFVQAEMNEERALFIRRSIFLPPFHLKQQIKREFVAVEKLLSAELLTLFQEGMENGELKQQRVENVLAFFYCVFDGIIVEQYYYEEDEYNARKRNSWMMFWQAIQN